MSWLRKALVHLSLSRSDAALIKASGGEPRTVRGMTLDPRLQFIEHEARRRAENAPKDTPKVARARTARLSEVFGGARVGNVRRERIFLTGRSHSVPARLYLPTVRDSAATMLVYFHFGGGVVGGVDNCDRLCALIARAASTPVLSVEYRLAPEHRFPAGLDDARAAYLWSVANAARYGAAVGKAAVGGDSIGAGFAASIAQEMKDSRGAKPLLQLLIYPLMDFTSDTASMHEFADAFPLTAERMEFFLEYYLPPGHDPNDVKVSPGRRQDVSGLAPALVYTAGFDMLLDQGEAYAQRLAEAGVPVRAHRFDTLPHGFVAFPSAAPAAEAAIRRIAREAGDALKGGAIKPQASS